jgi:SAM-dependent methyltransferase
VQHADHVALLRPGVPAAAKVWADFGAGRGAFSLALAELLGPNATLYLVDRDAGALRETARAVASRYPGVAVHPLAADFTRPLPPTLPPLDGAVMANALHFVPDAGKPAVVARLAAALKPGGRLLLVEYNVDRGNMWVPHPLTYARWEALARQNGFAHTRLLATRPSSFLKEFFAAESISKDLSTDGTD